MAPSRQLGIGCIGLVLFLLACLAGVWYAIAARGTARLQRELAQLTAIGEPTTASQLDALYPVPASDLSGLWLTGTDDLLTTAYHEAAHGLAIVDVADEFLDPLACLVATPRRPEIGDWPELARARQLIDDHADALSAWHQAAELGGTARFPTRVTPDDRIEFLARRQLDQASRLLSLEALVRAHQRDATACARSVETHLSLAECLRPTSGRDGVQLRWTLLNRTCSLLEYLLACDALESSDLSRIQQQLRAVQLEDSISAYLREWRLIGLDTAADDSEPFPISDYTEYGAFRTASDEDLAMFLYWMGRLQATVQRPLSQSIRKADRVLAEWDTIRRSLWQRLRYPLAGSMRPAWVNPFETAGTVAAACRSADTGIAIARFRRERGRSPEGFGELIPDYLPQKPLDPLSGEGLRWKVIDDAILVYSVGCNRTDDGGTRGPDYDYGQCNDIVFRVSGAVEFAGHPDN